MEQKRRSSKLKTEVVLSLLRGESAEELSRKYGVTMADIAQWRDEFIANGTQGFKKNPEESKLARAERRIGQLEIELDLVKKKNELVAKLRKG